MQQDYPIFKKFPSLEQATELKKLLDKQGIDAILGDNIPPVDVTFSGTTLQHEYEVRIAQSDFESAEKVLEAQAEDLINQVDEDYYLFEYSDEELYEILLKADEWNEFDYTLAQKILTQRGKSIDKDLLKSLKNERLKQLAKPEESQRPWIIAGYVFAFLGGFLGLIIGYFLWTAKKTLPNGQKVHSYSEKDRKQGKYIFYIALIIFPVALILRAISGL
ncbi:hypothetical protein [Flagellimonas myxillae]|uniref:hypothetical protein n=1 Tax=Flagellimonas myxillae TaxID=2942214 RepID=UPI00201FABEF|nr:hypothetical protein [Muricauda myxillae]MCL6264879.1 hypothetical protein [Muricauda myxillae]